MITLIEVIEVFKDHPLVTPNDVTLLKTKTGFIRIGTKFIMPDGSGLDVFIDLKKMVLTDAGSSCQKLLEYQMDIDDYKSIAADIAKRYYVILNQDRLQYSFNNIEELKNAFIWLSQACLQVTGLAYSRINLERQPMIYNSKDVVDFIELIQDHYNRARDSGQTHDGFISRFIPGVVDGEPLDFADLEAMYELYLKKQEILKKYKLND